MVTKAIHLSEFQLELVSDYSTKIFLAAFRKFVSLYQLPKLMMSDNGINFEGANREIRKTSSRLLEDKSLEALFANEGVEWRFIPPGAPHFIGLW